MNVKINKIQLGFWLGVAVISLINVLLNLLHKNQSSYDLYILGISIVILIIFLIILNKKK